MKQVIVVSKTHLDLGFTDYAENIEKKYIDIFIPNAIEIAKKLNTDKKRFVWTTGSWLIDRALNIGSEKQKKAVKEAIRNGDIVAHALPFTTHTELMSKELMEYGLSIVDKIDKLRGKKTISAKLTDVPGHTKALVKYLYNKGIKLLHVGVNFASKVPNVPPCFLWKYGECEVVVIYSSSGYGGVFKCDFIDDILYVDHTSDNKGTISAKETLKRFNMIEKKFKNYEVVAGTLDDYAEKIWKVKDKLPIVTEEIGDSWIHGVGTDFEKIAIFREFEILISEMIKKEELIKGTSEYEQVMNNLLCIVEHTWGYDVKVSLADYRNYLKKDFEVARFSGDNNGVINRIVGLFNKNEKKRNKYLLIERSWEEQREYLQKAAAALSDDKKKILQERIKKIVYVDIPCIKNNNLVIGKIYNFANNSICINKFGGITLNLAENVVLKENSEPIITYRSYGKCDYTKFHKEYNRNMKTSYFWAIQDFGRPLLGLVDKKFRQGEFIYRIIKGEVIRNDTNIKILAELSSDEYCYEFLGAPKKIYVEYTLSYEKLKIEIYFKDKPANRLSESLQTRFMINANNGLSYYKIGEKINPYDVIENGNRKLASVEKVEFGVGDRKFTINNIHASLVALGKVNILDYNNNYNDVIKDGISFVLSNNIWGTNFPLWQEGDGYFRFEIE